MIVGLTGGIGSGKSMVAHLFKIMGAKVFNSDIIAKEVYFDPIVKIRIIKVLGEKAYINDHTINKDYISERIFSDKELLNKINSIIHPEVGNRFVKFVNDNRGNLIIKESAILFETGIYRNCDKNIVVIAPLAQRIKWVMQRDNLSEELVKAKLNSQMQDEEKEKLSDFVIKNDESDFLITQVLRIVDQLKSA